MYKLYYFPGACSLAIQVILRELKQEVELIDRNKVADYSAINPVGAVPSLIDGDQVLREGAAIILYLLEKHPNEMLPDGGPERQQAIQAMMFANATMHPAYSRLFFISQHISDPEVKQAAFDAAADAINALWRVVDRELKDNTYFNGKNLGPAEVLLSVYSVWGDFFPVNIVFGKNSERMLNAVRNRPSFKESIAAEQKQQVAA